MPGTTGVCVSEVPDMVMFEFSDLVLVIHCGNLDREQVAAVVFSSFWASWVRT